jgi:hypothetical protein
MTGRTIEERQELRRLLAQDLGLPEMPDDYFFLMRIGDDYRDYPFNWEPFRDVAGPLTAGSASLPIVVISDSKERPEPEIRQSTSPFPHYEAWVSRTIPVERIASAWLELLVNDDASLGSYQGPFDCFPRGLGIRAEQLTEKGRCFLGL